MAKTFNNQAEVDAYLNSIVDKVLDNVAQKLLDHMHMILDEYLYNNGHKDGARDKNGKIKPNIPYYKHLYDNGGFYAGWTIEKSKGYVRTLLFDSSKLALNPEQASHLGSGDRDVRNLMPRILDDKDFEGKDENFRFHGSNYRDENPDNRSYWDMFQAQLNSLITDWFDEEFSKYGIKRG